MRKPLHAFLGIALVATSLSPALSTKASTQKSFTGDQLVTAAAPAHRHAGLENFDARTDPQTLELNGPTIMLASKRSATDRSAALDALKASLPTMPDSMGIEMHASGLPKTIANFYGALTTPRVGTPDAIAREFLIENQALFGLSAREVRKLKVTMNNTDETTGVTFMKYEQTIKGVPVFDSEIGITISAKGEVMIANFGQTIPGATVNPDGALSQEQAIVKAFEHCGVAINPEQVLPSAAKADDSSDFARFDNPLGEGHEPILSAKSVVNVAGEAVLAYRTYVDKGTNEWYDTLVDANTGELIYRTNIWCDVAGQVFTQHPGVSATGTRTLQQFAPLFGVTDPWVGSGTVTTGNNVDAYIDRDANNAPDSTTTASTGTNPGLTSGRADSSKGSPAGEFTFFYATGTTTSPTVEQANAVANLFYFNNYMHDWMYSLGFTESARNFQTNNFGRGGSGNDAVKAEAQDGSGTNNANFATPADGSAGRMQQYLFSGNRDSDLDGDVVLHEYGHGVSNRLIGNGSGLGGTQSGAMGEGWSDYWACSNYSDGVMGEYSTNNATRGIRRAAYTVPAATVHDSYADVGAGGFQVHNDGEVWAATLWDLNRTVGKTKADKLVLDGMKNTVTRPSMVAARTGIITACNTLYPADVCTVWTVFARHGLGNSASGNDGTTHIAATDLPASCGGTPPPPCSSGNTAIGDNVATTGSLATTDCTTTAGNGAAGAYYDLYTFSAAAGSALTITVNSSAFDTYVRLKQGSVVVAQDDDGNGGTNSKMTYTATSAASFTIEVSSYSPGSTGSYTVTRVGGGGGGGGTPVTLLSEGAEAGATGWTVSTNTTGNNWVISTAGRRAGTNGFRSSQAATSYVNNLDQSLISPAFSLSGKTSATLTFFHKHSTESNYDWFYVDISKDNGATWTTVRARTSGAKSGFSTTAGAGFPTSATTVAIPSGSLGSATTKIRFRFTTDGSVVGWGVAVDDIVLTAQ